jgi:hypothetical protein
MHLLDQYFVCLAHHGSHRIWDTSKGDEGEAEGGGVGEWEGGGEGEAESGGEGEAEGGGVGEWEGGGEGIPAGYSWNASGAVPSPFQM